MKYTTLWLIIVFTLTCSTSAQEGTNNTSGLLNCPSPLVVKDPRIPVNDDQICYNGCCLACPYGDNFYEENKIRHTFQSFAVVGIISFFLMIILSIFFVKLPSQRQNPLAKQILLPLALSVAYFEGSEFFTLNQRQSQCIDSITPADQYNNAYCAAQAVFTLGGGYAISCYSALLIIHLHLISVWRTEFIMKNIYFFHFFIIGISVAAIIVPFATNNVQSTNICFISLEKAASYFYFLCFIYIAFAAHLATIIYMAHITVKSSTNISSVSRRTSIIEAQRKLSYIKAIFKIQWRAFLGSLLMLLIYVLNWHYYVFNLTSLNSSVLTSSWVNNWLMCLKSNRGQSACASVMEDHVTNYYYIFILLFFNRTAGILIFIIFAAKKVVFFELYDIMRGRKLRSHPNPHVSYFETDSVRYSLHSIRGSLGRGPQMAVKQNRKGLDDILTAEGTELADSSNRVKEVTQSVKLDTYRRDSKMNRKDSEESSSFNDDTIEIVTNDSEIDIK